MNSRLLRRIAIGSALGLAALSCQHDTAVAPWRYTGSLRVLFIGNSLTYVNDLPEMVSSLASASGLSIQTASVTYGNYALIDHWNTGDARAAVENGHYDVVILQQGPSSLAVNRDSLRLWTAMWDPEIRRAGGRPGLYAVWPDKSRMFAFPDVNESYRLAAADVGGLFFPVGDTWIETWNLRPDAQLYGPDDFHPSVTGTYAAAVVIVSVLANRSATSLAPDFTLPASAAYDPLNPDVARDIRQAAETVINRNRAPAAR
jgi:hypothetical protein